MEGQGGTYMFSDGLKYMGSFSNNSRQGEGLANYHGTDANYEGLWRNGRYYVVGLLTLTIVINPNPSDQY